MSVGPERPGFWKSHWQQVPATNVAGWDFRILKREAMLPGTGVQFVSFPPGARITTHRHLRTEALVFTVSGRCRALLDGVEILVSAGEMLHVPKGMWHRWETLGDEPWENLVIHQPEAYSTEEAKDIEHFSGTEPPYLDAQDTSATAHSELLDTIGEAIIALDHVAIAARDAERVMEFYTQVLGFRFVRRQEAVNAAGDHAGDAQFITLEMPHDTRQLVIGMPTHDRSALHETLRAAGEGVHHMAFRVANLPQVVASLRARGVSFTTPEIVTDAQTGLRQIFVRPDQTGGIFIELLERSDRKVEGFAEENVAALVASEAPRGRP